MSKLKLLATSLIVVSLSALAGCASYGYGPMVGKQQCAATCSGYATHCGTCSTKCNHRCATKCNNRITNSIISQLNADSELSKLPIEVSTCHCVVKLRGTVYNQAQLNKVLYIASHTPGVRLVKTGITIHSPFINH